MRVTTVSTVYTDGKNRTIVHTVFELKKETLFYITGYNPLPVKGNFSSSFKILDNWLRDKGFFPIPDTKETIIRIQA